MCWWAVDNGDRRFSCCPYEEEPVFSIAEFVYLGLSFGPGGVDARCASLTDRVVFSGLRLRVGNGIGIRGDDVLIAIIDQEFLSL